MSVPDKDQITQWLTELADQGSHATVDRLMGVLYPELRRLAHKFFRNERSDHTLQPTALVHEAYLRLVDQARVGWEGRSHFLAIAAKVMRRVLIDHARGRARQRRGGREHIADIGSQVLPAEFTPAGLLEVDDALEKLAKLDARQAQVVEMRFFGGMTVAQIAKALIVFPGGFGTMDELWEMMTLSQTDKMPKNTLILIYGRKYWNDVLNLKGMVRWGTINQDEYDLLQYADTVEEAFEAIRSGLEKYHMQVDPFLQAY